MSALGLTPDQRELASLISLLSDSTYRASWMEDVEYRVWMAMHAADRRSGALLLTAEELRLLKEISERCGGWIVFDAVREEAFIGMAEWRRLLPA